MTGLLPFTLLLAGCLSTPKPIVSIEAGWNCLAYPSAFRDSGVVYAASAADGSATTFKDFHATPGVTVATADFVDVDASRSNKINASVLASLLGLPLKASASAGTTYTVTQVFSSAFRTDVDQSSDYALKNAFYASPDLAQAIQSGDALHNHYFLIRNTIRARTVSYGFDHDINASIDVNAPVHAVTGEVKGGLDDSSGLKFSKTFTEPQDVCLQVEALPVPPHTEIARRSGGPVAAAPPPPRATASGDGDKPLFSSYTR
jgi:hypothetical protein